MGYGTLGDLVDKQALENGDRVFLIVPETKRSLTFTDLQEETGRLAEELKEKGFRKGDKISVMLKNGWEAAVCFYAVAGAGGIVIPINFALTDSDLVYLLEDSDSSFLITSSDLQGNLEKKVSGLERTELEHGLLLFRLRENKAGTRSDPAEKPHENDLALILYTSGTTGKPKGVMMTHRNLLAEAFHIYEGHELTAQDRVLCLLPLFHINGLVVTLITPLLAGIPVVMPVKFSASRFWGWIGEYRITWFSAVPTILSIVLSREVPPELDLSSLRFARSASAALPVAVLEKFENKFHVPVIESYGISEGGSQITTNPMPPRKRKAGSVGIPIGNEIRVLNDKNKVLKAYEEGEVVVRGENITSGYYKKEEETRKAFINGWFHTGDLGYFDEEGYLYLKGRKKELINRAGEKFSPGEIDEVLYKIPEIELAAAVGVPDPLYNEEVVAYIKPRDGASLKAQEIIDFCVGKLADFKIPKEIIFTDDFPKGPSGKIQRLKFIERYAAGKEIQGKN
jgi:acyl-CoA synthetase (AMP-forming)/AMP-acid ligase II